MAAVIILIERAGSDAPGASDDVLRQAGYEVVVMEDAGAAIAAAVDLHASMILLRAHGPTVETLNVCRALRTPPETRSVPLLVIARVDDLYTREQFVRIGATAILVDPPRPALLLRQVRRLTGRRTAMRRDANDGVRAPSADPHASLG